ncbi:MAG TPA: hypothetical protein VK747_08380 [Blastocatellia bacterium]|nr:hypothetical protein [Blastocatellia bacterium]
MNTMVGCNQTRRLIDEADRPESLPFEASSHVARCPDCESFAEERARLRSLLGSGTRVSVPMNFDAVLKARLAKEKARPAFGWLSPPVYLRLGAATAGLVVMIFAAQYAGLFSRDNPTGQQQTMTATTELPGVIAPAQPAVAAQPATVRPVAVGPRNPSSFVRGNRNNLRAAGAGVSLVVAREDYLHEDGGVMLVRGANGDPDVSLPMVSVGAQSRVYAGANSGRLISRTIGTSF